MACRSGIAGGTRFGAPAPRGASPAAKHISTDQPEEILKTKKKKKKKKKMIMIMMMTVKKEEERKARRWRRDKGHTRAVGWRGEGGRQARGSACGWENVVVSLQLPAPPSPRPPRQSKTQPTLLPPLQQQSEQPAVGAGHAMARLGGSAASGAAGRAMAGARRRAYQAQARRAAGPGRLCENDERNFSRGCYPGPPAHSSGARRGWRAPAGLARGGGTAALTGPGRRASRWCCPLTRPQRRVRSPPVVAGAIRAHR